MRQVVLGGALIAAALLIGLATPLLGPASGIEPALMRTLALTRPWAAEVGRGVTALGDPSMRPVLIGAGALLLWSAGKRREILVLLLGSLAAIGATSLLKQLFDRARPHVVPWLDSPSNASFPSGHAANTMAVLLLAALLLGGRRRVAAALAVALLVGLTRPALGVHWPSDVVGGWALGAGIALLSYGLTRRHSST